MKRLPLLRGSVTSRGSMRTEATAASRAASRAGASTRRPWGGILLSMATRVERGLGGVVGLALGVFGGASVSHARGFLAHAFTDFA